MSFSEPTATKVAPLSREDYARAYHQRLRQVLSADELRTYYTAYGDGTQARIDLPATIVNKINSDLALQGLGRRARGA